MVRLKRGKLTFSLNREESLEKKDLYLIKTPVSTVKNEWKYKQSDIHPPVYVFFGCRFKTRSDQHLGILNNWRESAEAL